MPDFDGAGLEGVARISKKILDSNSDSNANDLRENWSADSASEATKTAEKPPFNSTIERVSVDGAEVLQRLRDAFAADDWTGPAVAGNVWFFEKLDDGCRQITAKREDETDDTHDRSVYEDFSCPDDGDPGGGGGGFQIEVLAGHKRDSTGDLADPSKRHSEALDAKTTKFMKAGKLGPDIVPLEHRCEKASDTLKAIEAERQALRGLHR